MSNEFEKLNQRDRLIAENQFLRMKLMLERGVELETTPGMKLPPEVEHMFLQFIERAENELSKRPCDRRTVFEQMGKPDHFKPVESISDAAMREAWSSLREQLEEHGFAIIASNPEVTDRELYRFATEEIFPLVMEGSVWPGMITTFLYDEYHPDPVSDITLLLQCGLLGNLFRSEELCHRFCFSPAGFNCNGIQYDHWDTFYENIQRFKHYFDRIQLASADVQDCIFKNDQWLVKGRYEANACSGVTNWQFKGAFETVLCRGQEDNWQFENIRIDGWSPHPWPVRS